MVKETKNSEATLPTALEVHGEPKTSDDMETDSQQKESNTAWFGTFDVPAETPPLAENQKFLEKRLFQLLWKSLKNPKLLSNAIEMDMDELNAA